MSWSGGFVSSLLPPFINTSTYPCAYSCTYSYMCIPLTDRQAWNTKRRPWSKLEFGRKSPRYLPCSRATRGDTIRALGYMVSSFPTVRTPSHLRISPCFPCPDVQLSLNTIPRPRPRPIILDIRKGIVTPNSRIASCVSSCVVVSSLGDRQLFPRLFVFAPGPRLVFIWWR